MSRRKTKTKTTISIYPGIDIVAKPGASEIVIGAIRERLAELQDDFVDEQIADLLGDHDGDRYEMAKELRAHPERIEQIGKLIARTKRRAS
jgi:hypothetical protein